MNVSGTGTHSRGMDRAWELLSTQTLLQFE